VKDVDAARERVVRNDAAMAAPPQHLGAHDRGWLFARPRQEPAQCSLKLARLGVVRVVLERAILPPRVARRLRRLRRPAPATEVALLDEANSVARQLVRERAGVELRVRSRAREVADVDEGLDAVRAQRLDELRIAAVRVSDREQLHFVAAALNRP
jgi:hypothetical protein